MIKVNIIEVFAISIVVGENGNNAILLLCTVYSHIKIMSVK